MGIESRKSDQDITSLTNQPISQTAGYGGAGGADSNFCDCAMGNYVTNLTTYISFDSSAPEVPRLNGLSLTFNDGTAVTFGHTTTDSNSLDLSNDSIATMYVLVVQNVGFSGDPKKNGCGGIYIETVKGNTFESYFGCSPATYLGNWNLVKAPDGGVCQNIFLVGANVNSGTLIDNLSFYYKDDILISRIVQNFNYANLAATTPQPINVASAWVSNQTAIEQQMTIGFSKSYSSSVNWQASAGITLGVSTEMKAGIPFLASESVEVSVEISFEYSWGEEYTQSNEFNYSAVVSVPPLTTINAAATATSYQLNGTYTADFVENWAHAGPVVTPINGTVQGLVSYNAEVTYTTVPASASPKPVS